MADNEIEAMGTLADALSKLDEDERGRVLRWAADKYGVGIKKPTPTLGDIDDSTDDEEPDPDGDYEHFADLFAAAQPASDPDKVLVAAYWTQHIEGTSTYGSQQLNDHLKELGHRVSDINKKLTTLINAKPAKMLQVKRSGSSKQARKSYKMTAEGVKAVNTMLSGGAE